MARVAVLGGTFDPPHIAHHEIALNAIAEFGYRRLIILPSYNPPHKRAVGDSEDRLNMVKLAFAHQQLEICDMEMRADGYGYTVNTLPKLLEYIGEPFDFIIGGDSLRDFDKWYRWQDILRTVKLIVAVRDDNYDAVRASVDKYSQHKNMGIEVMRHKPTSISSSQIRLMRQLGGDISPYLDSQVNKYIECKGLYAEYDQYRSRLQSTLSKDRYIHSLNTAEYAAALGGRLGLGYDQVVTAALLHDCAKYDMDYSELALPIGSVGTPVAHAFAGAEVARSDYGVIDAEVLDAIYYHCTAKADMTLLAKVVFVADMLEKSRDWQGIEALRALVERDFDKGFRQCVTKTYENVCSKSDWVYPLTLQAYEYYKDK